MKKILIAILCTTATFASAQVGNDGFQITAKTSGIADTIVHLVASNTDTLASAKMNRGVFFIQGKVTTPDVAYIRPEGTQAVIPIMLENANFQILANAQGVKIVGGEAQERYDRYVKLQNDTHAEQNRVQQALQEAYQAGDEMKMQGLQNVFSKYVEKARKQEQEMFDSLTTSFVGMYLLASNMQQMPAAMLRERYDKFPANLQQSPNGKAVADYLEQAERIMEGKEAPDFSLPNVEGDTISLNKVKGKVKIVDFWASWCAPCRKEMPTLVKLYKHYQTKGLEIISVSIDDKADAWKRAAFEEGITWKSVRATDGAKSDIIPLYGIKSIPFILILDANNKIIAINLRGKELESKIEELLK